MKEVAFIFMFFVAILSKAHFMMSRGFLFTFFFFEVISFFL